jgi:hypothetical protein
MNHAVHNANLRATDLLCPLWFFVFIVFHVFLTLLTIENPSCQYKKIEIERKIALQPVPSRTLYP